LSKEFFVKSILIFLYVVFLTGCVVGQEYNYEMSSMNIPIEASEQKTLILAVEDRRPYVLSGEKEPSFVGLQRGGFGEPWDVTTASGKPMTEDMSVAIVKGLKDAGYTVVNVPGNNDDVYLVKAARKNNASRIVILKVFDWKSDVYTAVTLHSNLHLSVLDAEGKLLAGSSFRSMEKIAGGSWATGDDNSRALAYEFSRRVRNLFNEDEVSRALQ
jgi:hypothetical protein